MNRLDNLIDNGGYIFYDDNFSLENAYVDCKIIFDEITDDEAFQQADTGVILYHAREIMYALNAALKDRKDAIPVEWIEKKMQWLREHNGAFYNPAYFLETMLAEWKEEQNDSDQ